ncbi:PLASMODESMATA CALLOSE-BINDING PROTEIN 5 [Abeliophyllum distichum]|uniref:PLASMODESMATA CALLOSE-BINDING PROTEIN 5 n=1 Tax=Abeliophyllum distichum TaxID=126358 RepID=A0ABD1PRQ3_9LAMI
MAPGIFSHALVFFFSLITATFPAQGGGGGGVATVELWCVAKNNAEDAALQPALDWACGPGGADCRPIQNDGPCYDPLDLQRTASFAFNDYFIKHGLTADSCNFSNTAALTSLNPSHNNCKFPSSLSTSSGGVTGSVTAGKENDDLTISHSIIHRWHRGLITLPLFFGIILLF